MTKRTHTHHIIPKHMGGTNDIDNLIELEIQEHAEAHYQLYLKYGKIQDKIAWLALSGKTYESESLRKELAQKSFQEYISNPDNKRKWRDKISKTLTGRRLNEEHRRNISKGLRLAYEAGRKKHVRASLDFYQQNYKNNKEKMDQGRRESVVWKYSVTNETYKKKKSEGMKDRTITWGDKISDSKRNKKLYNSIELEVNSIKFNSIAQASRYFKIPRWKLRKLINKFGNSFTI